MGTRLRLRIDFLVDHFNLVFLLQQMCHLEVASTAFTNTIIIITRVIFRLFFVEENTKQRWAEQHKGAVHAALQKI